YTNNFAGTTATVLFDIETSTDRLYVQAASGETAGTLTNGLALGVDAASASGFDITRGGSAHAILTVGAQTALYDIDLATGAATIVAALAVDDVIGFAVNPAGGDELDIDGSAGEAIALTSTGKIVTFAPATPATIATRQTITGLASNERLLGGDVRPSDGRFYALGTTGRVYVINAETGVATAQQVDDEDLIVSVEIEDGLEPLALNANIRALDFNPVVDRLRVIGGDQNLVVNVDTGVVVRQNAVRIPNTSTVPDVQAAAYSNNFLGAVSTTLYDIDVVTDSLYTQVAAAADSATIGNLTLVGSLGIDATAAHGFDIQQSTGTARAILTVDGETALYAINLGNGATTRIAVVGAANVIDYAQELDGGITEANTWGITQVDGAVRVVNFDFTTSAISRSIPARGLAANETVEAFDYAIGTDELLAITSAKKLYVVDRNSGTFTARGAALPYEGTAIGFDVNHTTDPLLARVISSADDNITVVVATGVATARGDIAFTDADSNGPLIPG
ncbi:MAG TPA: DUF4394 domain-containing protein, partial [Myxococcota bacterium]